MLKSVVIAGLLLLAAGAAGAALVVWSGVVDVAATAAGGPPDRVLAYAAIRSIRHHAKADSSAAVRDPSAMKAGLSLYRSMCVACHSGPGAAPAEFAAGLHPSAPDLTSAEIQAFSDGMLYQTISQGIGSTGMPAFGPTHSAKDLWSLVAFVRHLPVLSADEKRQLGGPTEPVATAPLPTATNGAQVHRVSITNFKFDPPALDVSVGGVVEWVNADFVAHTATADDGAFDTGKIDEGEAKRVVATKKGTFPYFCRYHAAMRGTLTVR